MLSLREFYRCVSVGTSKRIIDFFSFVEDTSAVVFLLEFPGNQATLLKLSNYTSAHCPRDGNKGIEGNIVKEDVCP